MDLENVSPNLPKKLLRSTSEPTEILEMMLLQEIAESTVLQSIILEHTLIKSFGNRPKETKFLKMLNIHLQTQQEYTHSAS